MRCAPPPRRAEAIVGAGTILTPRQYDQATAAGARFVVSPGMTQELLDAARGSDVPLLPAAITPSEIMAAMEEGYSLLKFFPAEASGGAAALKALGGPLPQVSFCPTGGVSPGNAGDYLKLSTVPCVGGSWIAPADLVAAGDWSAIEVKAREAAGLSG